MDRAEEARRLREEYEASLDEAEAKRAEYHRSVLKLHRSGMPLREIASALGLSHQRVHQIVTGEPSPKRRRRRVAGGTAMAIVLLLGLITGYLRLAHLPPFKLASATIKKVPSVSGLTAKQASMVLDAFGFSQGRAHSEPSSTIPRGS